MSTLAGGGTGVPAARTLMRAARFFALAAAALSVVVLVLWSTDPNLLDMLSPGRTTMKVNTSIATVLVAASVVARRGWAVAVLCVAVAALALASLAEYAFGFDLGIDQAVIADTVTRQRDAPGRMAPVPAASLLLLCGATWAGHRRATRAANVLCALPLVIAVVALLGYLFRVEQVFTVVAFTTIALPSAVALCLLTLAVACAVPGGAAWWVALDKGAGATLVRHMLPVAVVVLPVLGMLPLIGTELEIFGQRFGLALLVFLSAGVVLAVAVVAARRLDTIDRERRRAESGLRELNEQLRERRDTEWRRAEELSRDLRGERARFQRAIGKVDDLIWTVEVMADGTLRPEFASGNASGLFGAGQHGDDLARTITTLVHPDDRPLLDSFDDRIRSGRPADTEVRVVGYDGAVRWVWLRGTPRREGSRLFVDGISTNVTERRELAERRENLLSLEQEQVRRLRQLNQLREELLAVTGHELRTPLAVVRGYAELMLQDSDLTEQQRRHLEVVANRSRQVALLVDDIFDLATFSAGLASIDPRPVALDQTVTTVVAEHRAAAESADLSLDVDVAPVTVAGDPTRLRQILDNLMSNAIKYSLPGGQVTVTAGPAGEQATITVSNAGIGIPESELEHVFDRMYRATTAKEREIKGTGLGLSVAKALVEAHEGTISVENRPEGGTRFTVAIPVQREGEADTSEARAAEVHA